MHYKIDLNSDLGESFGAYKLGQDDKIIPLITSANIACGWHAGDACVMGDTVKMAAVSGTGIGAHPGFPDLMGFGRREMDVSAKELKAYLQYQIGALYAFCKACGSKLQHVKAHGALYNMAVKNPEYAGAVCEAVASFSENLILLAPYHSQMRIAAQRKGIRYRSEVFADRAYMADGSLVPRSNENAMITDEDEAVKRVLKMIRQGTVTTAQGTQLDIKADSVCVHGDSEKALCFIEKLRKAFAENEIEVAALSAL